MALFYAAFFFASTRLVAGLAWSVRVNQRSADLIDVARQMPLALVVTSGFQSFRVTLTCHSAQ